MCLLYYIHSLQPNRKVKGHYRDPSEAYALFKSGEDGVEVIRVSFNNWEELDLCALLCIIIMDSLHPAISVGVRELRIVGFDHPPQSVSPGVSSG